MADLRPFLLPSGRNNWQEQWVDASSPVPETVRYWAGRWRVIYKEKPPLGYPPVTPDAWAPPAPREGLVLVCVPDRGTFLGRLWWKHLVPAAAQLLYTVGGRLTARRWDDRAEAYPFGGRELSWTFEIGPNRKPWHNGDEQPQDGYWPYSIAVFGPEAA